jgi:hypothetical protein
LHRVLQITSPISWADIIGGSLILAVGVYKFIESPSVILGIFVLILVIILIFLLFLRDEVRFDASDEGVVESKFWTITGVKKYRYQGLSKARAIITVDIDGVDSGEIIKGFLLFEDGYRHPIPGDNTISEKIISWFQNNYNTTLNIKEEKPSEMRKAMRDERKKMSDA